MVQSAGPKSFGSCLLRISDCGSPSRSSLTAAQLREECYVKQNNVRELPWDVLGAVFPYHSATPRTPLSHSPVHSHIFKPSRCFPRLCKPNQAALPVTLLQSCQP